MSQTKNTPRRFTFPTCCTTTWIEHVGGVVVGQMARLAQTRDIVALASRGAHRSVTAAVCTLAVNCTRYHLWEVQLTNNEPFNILTSSLYFHPFVSREQ